MSARQSLATIAMNSMRTARDGYFVARLAQLDARIRAAGQGEKASPRELFRDVSDRFWLYLNTEGLRRSAYLRQVLPSLPDPQIQLRFTGMSGDDALYEAYCMYGLCKRMIQQHRGPLVPSDTILDYGCGWGRVLRFFLKEVEPANLQGVDPLAEVLDIARQTNRYGNFQLIPAMPPTSLPDASVDVIYLFSVFSHLSEEAHLRLLAEFKRLLRPGGLVIATTRPREFILRCAELRRLGELPPHLQGGALSFLDTAATLDAYDRGEFCFSPTGGGDLLESSFYGEACIPRAYAEARWSEYLKVVDFIDDRALLPQAVIVAKR